MTVLEITNLSRTFRSGRDVVHALRDVDLRIEAGETVGLLGVNGAGKTTLLKVVSTLLLPTAGAVRVDGVDVVRDTREARRRLAVVFGGERGFYNRLSARDNAYYFALLGGLSRRVAGARVGEALERVGIRDAADRRVETFSKGMKQRLHRAVGLLGAPKLLMLDEPTVGLDPIEAHRFRESLAALRDTGATILLTSHYLGDIERLAHRVVILDQGQILRDVQLEHLLATAGAAAEVTIRGHGRLPVASANGAAGVRVVDRTATDGRWTVTYEVFDWSPASLRALAAAWPEANVVDVRVQPTSLEHVFSRLALREER